MNLIKFNERIDSWSNVPNSYVNDDGKPNLNNSNVQNDNNARLSVRFTELSMKRFYASRQSDGGLRLALLVFLVHWFRLLA